MLKNKKADTINWWIIIGAIIALLALIFAGMVIWRSFTSGEKSTQSNMPCNPAGEKKNCFDVATKTYYNEEGKAVDASGQAVSPTGEAMATSTPGVVKVNTDPTKKEKSDGVPNDAWEKLTKTLETGEYDIRATFEIGANKINEDKVIVYYKEKNWNKWCIRSITAGKLEGDICNNFLTAKLEKMPTKADSTAKITFVQDMAGYWQENGLKQNVPVVLAMDKNRMYTLETYDKKKYAVRFSKINNPNEVSLFIGSDPDDETKMVDCCRGCGELFHINTGQYEECANDEAIAAILLKVDTDSNTITARFKSCKVEDTNCDGFWS